MNSAGAGVFWQQLVFTWKRALGVSLLDCRWLAQHGFFACPSPKEFWGWRQQHFPPEADGQRDLPQQQPSGWADSPRQNDLWVPSRQMQSKCGTPTASVATAVSQTNPPRKARTRSAMPAFFRTIFARSRPFSKTNRIWAANL